MENSQAEHGSGGEKFASVVDQLPIALYELLGSRRFRWTERAEVPAKPGLYLLTEGGKPVYVGQTRNLRKRLTQHGALYSWSMSATFAFRIAKIEAKKRGLNTRRFNRKLEADPEFAKLFVAAKQRVAAMEAQVIQMEDPITRTVFEVYAAVMLDTPKEYNDFQTH